MKREIPAHAKENGSMYDLVIVGQINDHSRFKFNWDIFSFGLRQVAECSECFNLLLQLSSLSLEMNWSCKLSIQKIVVRILTSSASSFLIFSSCPSSVRSIGVGSRRGRLPDGSSASSFARFGRGMMSCACRISGPKFMDKSTT